MIDLKIPFPNPYALGYRGNRSTVAFWWEAGGDELACFDGQFLTCGMCDNYMFLQWFRDNGWMMTTFKIGDCETEAENCIVVDMAKERIAVMDKNETFKALRDAFFQEATANTN